jgi:tetratricopeptide (TPR) repeat protein
VAINAFAATEAALVKRQELTSSRYARLLRLGCSLSELEAFSVDTTRCARALAMVRQYFPTSDTYTKLLNTMALRAMYELNHADGEKYSLEAIDVQNRIKDTATYDTWPLGYLVANRVALRKFPEAKDAVLKLSDSFVKDAPPLSLKRVDAEYQMTAYQRGVFEFAQVREALERAVKAGLATKDGEYSVFVWRSQRTLAEVLTEMGDFDGAMKQYAAAMTVAVPTSAVGGGTLNNRLRPALADPFTYLSLAGTLAKAGELVRAREALTRADAMAQAPMKRKQFWKHRYSTLLADIELRSGAPEKALALLMPLEVPPQPTAHAPHVYVTTRDALKVRVLTALKRWNEAEAIVEPLLREIEQAQARDFIPTSEADLLVAKAELATARGRHGEAISARKRAINLYERREYSASPFLAERNLELAMSYARAGQGAEAKQLVDKQSRLLPFLFAPGGRFHKAAGEIATIKPGAVNAPRSSVIAVK